MIIKIISVVVFCLYAIFNLLTAKKMSATEMKESFISGQCVVGKIFANIFYLPAWMLKGIKFVVVSTVK